MNAADYENEGRKAYRAGHTLESRPAGGWQAAAWLRGHALEQSVGKRRGDEPPANDAEVARGIVGDTSGWPAAAREHVARLIADISRECACRRSARLMKAVRRMAVRHNQGATQ